MKIREYTPPVFHIERAGAEQIKTAEAIFQTMIKSGIAFAVCKKDTEENNTINVFFYGAFDVTEELNIIKEVKNMYRNNSDISVGVGSLI